MGGEREVSVILNTSGDAGGSGTAAAADCVAKRLDRRIGQENRSIVSFAVGAADTKLFAMKTRKLGPNGPQIATVGLGCMGMSEFYGASEDKTSIDVIHRALDIGVNFFDTADMYGSGENEKLLGRALQGKRDRAVVATKFAILRGEGGSFVGISGKPEHVKQACDASLKRLGLDVIDLYYQHRVDPSVPIEDTVGAMKDLVNAGKVRWLGLSEAKPETLRRACKVHPIAALQTEYSLWSREPEAEILQAAAALGVTFVAYSPLGRGFLTGAIKSLDDLEPNDWRRHMPRFSKENFPKNLELLRRVNELAASRKITPAQLALAWAIGAAENVVTIPGTRSIKRLEENAAAADITLTAAERSAIDEAIPKDLVVGTRYPEQSMSSVNG
jgi:aryl-alcohol dehydrogenase-like predicted oxidoreductase